MVAGTELLHRGGLHRSRGDGFDDPARQQPVIVELEVVPHHLIDVWKAGEARRGWSALTN